MYIFFNLKTQETSWCSHPHFGFDRLGCELLQFPEEAWLCVFRYSLAHDDGTVQHLRFPTCRSLLMRLNTVNVWEGLVDSARSVSARWYPIWNTYGGVPMMYRYPVNPRVTLTGMKFRRSSSLFEPKLNHVLIVLTSVNLSSQNAALAFIRTTRNPYRFNILSYCKISFWTKGLDSRGIIVMLR